MFLCPLYAVLRLVPLRVCGERLVEVQAYLRNPSLVIWFGDRCALNCEPAELMNYTSSHQPLESRDCPQIGITAPLFHFLYDILFNHNMLIVSQAFEYGQNGPSFVPNVLFWPCFILGQWQTAWDLLSGVAETASYLLDSVGLVHSVGGSGWLQWLDIELNFTKFFKYSTLLSFINDVLFRYLKFLRTFFTCIFSHLI